MHLVKILIGHSLKSNNESLVSQLYSSWRSLLSQQETTISTQFLYKEQRRRKTYQFTSQLQNRQGYFLLSH